jgi:filamentous hemagglutinin family protein
LAGALWAIASLEDCALAQIIPDTTLGSENSTVTPITPTVDQINGGVTRGTNLFHSFQEFNIGNRRSVFFTNPAGIENILARVTGANPSNILGTLGVNGGNANLFLINPNGIIFGQNARLSLNGSFVATTANAIGLANGDIFSANPVEPLPNQLLNVNPNAFFFNQVAAQPIINRSTANSTGLQVPQGQSLLLVGGEVRLEGGQMQAPGGRVELGGVAGTGTVGLSVNGNDLRLSFPVGVQRADVSLNNSAEVDVRAGRSGSIAINAQNLNMAGGSGLEAGIDSGRGSISSVAGDVEINAIGTINLNDSFIANAVRTEAVGQGGDINIMTGSLSLTNGAQLVTSTRGPRGRGDVGSVNINARDTVSLDGVSSDGFQSGAFSTVGTGAVGKGGDINITTASLSLTNGAALAASTFGQGDAGSVKINARDTVSLDGVSVVRSRVELGVMGQGGDVNITTGSLSVTNGAQLSASTLGQGDAGSVTITAHDTVSFDGVSSDGFQSGAFSTVEPGAVGKGGDVNITTGSLSLTNHAQLSSGTRGQGNAGNVNINAQDTVSFRESTALSAVGIGAVGKGGDVNITTGSLSVTNGAELNASTEGEGDAGRVRIQARDAVFFDGASAVFSLVLTGAVGNSGGINITTGLLSLTNGAQLVTSTMGQGDAGSVNINARETVSFDGEGRDGLSSAAFSTVDAGAVGKGGDINITTGSLSVTNGAELIATTFGQGDAGSVTITARDAVSFDGVRSDGFSSGAYSAVGFGGVGNGSGIKITTRSLSVTNGALLSASTLGQGNGGNITLNANTLEVVNGGQVRTSSVSSGKAGNITVNATGSVNLAGSSGLFANTSETSTAQGGDLRITTGQLNVRDGAEVTVSSEGLGNAGELRVEAGSIFLNNQGKLQASTASGEGGNIDLQVGDLILMRRNSLISARADNNGNGGNITINAPFIVAIPSENSDIVADAFRGQGGNISITSQGIYGLEYRQELTAESDINASSEFGVDGTVEINSPDVDPSRGLVNLPAVPIDTEVAQGCSPGGSQSQSEFVVTGRGGLPPNPGEALSTDAVQVDLITPNPEVAQLSTPAVSTSPISSTPSPIVEAQGWVIDANGNVVLMSVSPTVTPHSSWQRTADCQKLSQKPGR